MVDKVIGELPSISSLDDESLFVAEQNGQAVKVSGKQLTDFSNVETTAQVEQAKASAQEAKTAQAAAEAAILKGPIIQNGTWWVYNQTVGTYQDTGIKATGPQGIPGPTSSVNGISPDDSGNITITAGNVNAYSKTESDTLLAGKAPAGYGLGEVVAKTGRDANAITKNGFYRCDVNTPTTEWWYGIHVQHQEGYAYQEFCRTETKDRVVRQQINSTWQPWEWVNPPMQLGVEYRTTERYLGKPVYAKTIDLGALPNNEQKNVSIGASIAVALSCNLSFGKSGTYTYSAPFYGGADIGGISVTAHITGSNVRCVTTADYSDFTAVALCKYTKTTD